MVLPLEVTAIALQNQRNKNPDTEELEDSTLGVDVKREREREREGEGEGDVVRCWLFVYEHGNERVWKDGGGKDQKFKIGCGRQQLQNKTKRVVCRLQ